MKEVGKRIAPPLLDAPTGAALAAGIAFSANLAKLAGKRMCFPKGVYRYKSHAQANQQEAEWLAQGMAALAKERSRE